MENQRRTDAVARAEARRAFLARAAIAGVVLATLALVAGAAYGAHRVLTTAEFLRIREIRWSGLSRATAEELAALSPVQPGDNLVRADEKAMARALERHPWVKRAEAHRRLLPPSIDVEVTERRVAALVELGGLYLVDGDAEPFKRAAPGDGLDLPLVTGLSRDDYVQRRAEVEPLLAGALALLDGYAQAGLAPEHPISEVHVDLDSGITIYVGEQGTQVRLGHGELPQKLSRLRRTLSALGAEARRAEVVHLDNRARPTWATVRMAGGVGGPGGVSSPGSKAGGKGPRGL